MQIEKDNNMPFDHEVIDFFKSLKKINTLNEFNEIKSFVLRYKTHFNEDYDLFSKLYEKYLKTNLIRKTFGIYYTPNYIIKFIIKETVEIVFENLLNKINYSLEKSDLDDFKKYINEFLDVKIIDIACGTGSFLIIVLKTIWNYYLKLEELFLNLKQNLAINRESVYFNNIIQDLYISIGFDNKKLLISKIILRHIYGIDLDSTALLIAKLNLLFNSFSLITNKLVLKNIDGNIDDFIETILLSTELNLLVGDALIDFDRKQYELLKDNYTNEIRSLIKLKYELLNNKCVQTIIDKINNIKNKIKFKFNQKIEQIILNSKDSQEKNFNLKPLFLYLEYFNVFYNEDGGLKSKNESGFDIVIGNPPYFTEVRGFKDRFRIYKKSPSIKNYYEQKMDIFYYFIERGLDLLKNNGFLGYIIMDYWEDRTFGKNLRKKIIENSIIKFIVRFNNFKVFSEAKGQHNSIIILNKRLTVNDKNDYEVDVISIIDPNISVDNIKNFLLQNELCNGIKRNKLIVKRDLINKLRIDDSITFTLFEKMRNLQNFSIPDTNIVQGLVIPQSKVKKMHFSLLKNKLSPEFKEGDGIFVISTNEKLNLNLSPDELKLIKPFYNTHNINPFYYDKDNLDWIIYITKPFIEFDRNEIKNLDLNQVSFKNQDVHNFLKSIRDKYNSITQHLDKFKLIITSDKKPYGLHRPRRQSIFESKNKIISVRKTNFPKFVHVPINYYMDQSVYYIIIDDKSTIHYLTGLFNSKLAWFFFKKLKTHGTQLQIDKEVIKKFPIYYSKPHHIIVNEIVNNIINLKTNYHISNVETQISDLITDLDVIFFRIYNLTLAEVEYILNFIQIEQQLKSLIINKFLKKRFDT
ncbi:MAG: Eco57I restriction-modification methylase domain-containing protein [Candidatus Helarchaeota archaeon]